MRIVTKLAAGVNRIEYHCVCLVDIGRRDGEIRRMGQGGKKKRRGGSNERRSMPCIRGALRRVSPSYGHTHHVILKHLLSSPRDLSCENRPGISSGSGKKTTLPRTDSTCDVEEIWWNIPLRWTIYCRKCADKKTPASKSCCLHPIELCRLR